MKIKTTAPWFSSGEEPKIDTPSPEPRCVLCQYMATPALNRMRGEPRYCAHPSTLSMVNRTIDDFAKGGQFGPGSPSPNWCPLR